MCIVVVDGNEGVVRVGLEKETVADGPGIGEAWHLHSQVLLEFEMKAQSHPLQQIGRLAHQP